jgi:hypothetical protein
MTILRLLFPIKFSTTLIKGAPPCKISKLDFLIVNLEHSRAQGLVNITYESILVILVNMNIVPLMILSVIKVL